MRRHVTIEPWLATILESDEEHSLEFEKLEDLSEQESKSDGITLTRLELHHDRTLDELYPKLRFSIQYLEGTNIPISKEPLQLI